MKVWKCPICSIEKFSDEKIIIRICYACQVAMDEVKDGKIRVSKL